MGRLRRWGGKNISFRIDPGVFSMGLAPMLRLSERSRLRRAQVLLFVPHLFRYITRWRGALTKSGASCLIQAQKNEEDGYVATT